MAKRRQFSAFSLSFLDIMSCGFGAVILLFMLINHGSRIRSEEINEVRLSEASKLEEQVLDGRQELVRIKNALTETEKDVEISAGLAREVIDSLTDVRKELAMLDKDTLAKKESIEKLKADIKSEEEDAERLRGEVESFDDEGDALRSFVGDGSRQYLTGLRMGGERILILLDASASMLDETIVNVIRRRNLPDNKKIQSKKWQRAVATVDWLSTQIPRSSKFQMYSFNTKAKPLLEGTEGTWLITERGKHLNAAIESLGKVVPQGGTSLHAAWDVVLSLDPMPDNIFLIVDGLPTQARNKPRKNVATARDRAKHFRTSLESLPGRIPVNIILFPMEGDPGASAAYWMLASETGGSYMTPSKDWP